MLLPDKRGHDFFVFVLNFGSGIFQIDHHIQAAKQYFSVRAGLHGIHAAATGTRGNSHE